MKTQPLFVIPDLPPENRRPEPIEEKQKMLPELPEKDQPEPEKKKKDRKEEKPNLPPDPAGNLGGKIDLTA
ncbi:MAG: hypothetical protein PHE24_06410 [Patescibacteria group bacterium]|nr:hypothetical protein [Patescibacteria group bacterium]